MIERIISGGQSGADKAALEAAKAIGIPTGGTAPKGWRIQNYDGSDGSDPTLAGYGLVEHQSREYPPRTRQNVADSDGTVWFGYLDSPGAKLTLTTAQRMGKPTLTNPTPQELRDWCTEHKIKVLNVAGNRASHHNPDIWALTYATLASAFGELTTQKRLGYITAHLEYLYHYKCDYCEKWWTVADIQPAINSAVYCPHCGLSSIVEAIESHQKLPEKVLPSMAIRYANEMVIVFDQEGKQIPELQGSYDEAATKLQQVNLSECKFYFALNLNSNHIKISKEEFFKSRG